MNDGRLRAALAGIIKEINEVMLKKVQIPGMKLRKKIEEVGNSFLRRAS